MMTKFLITALIVVITSFPLYYIFLKPPPPLPKVDLGAWWGPEDAKKNQTTAINSFKVTFDKEMIKDLKERLSKRSKFTSPLEGVGFQYGFNSNILNSWLKYWAEEYDFAEREKFFNKYPQFTTNIQGLDIHFIKVMPNSSPKTDKVPLLLLHAWATSVREFYEAIPSLTAASKSRDFALELIIPSLPGYGFSSAAVRPGLGVNEIAVVLRNLMQRLGYKKYYVQGGDIIGISLVTLFPDEVLGYHTSVGFVMSERAALLELIASVFPSLIMESKYAERIYPLKKKYLTFLEEAGYMHIQATKPDTIGISLTDSPAGLLVYILEKFSSWTNMNNREKSDGGLEEKWTKEKLIDNLMVYWSTNSITSSIRLYAESFNSMEVATSYLDIPTPVPTWIIQPRHGLAYSPPCILKFKYPNLVKARPIDDGGHFLAFELPEVFAEDVLIAIGEFRKLRKNKMEL